MFVALFYPSCLYADTHKFWIDTSHWESVPIEYIEQGYWQVTPRQKWVDTSYTVNQGYWDNYTERVWVDTSYTVNQGYWDNYTERVWVPGYYKTVTETVWVPGYYVPKTSTTWKWVSCSIVFYSGYTPPGVPTYVLSSGYYQGTINGTLYKYKKTIYVPYLNFTGLSRTVYECYSVYKQVVSYYQEWVPGYYKTVTTQEWVPGYYKTVTGRRWVDTSYTVSQGYWTTVQKRRWVDTSYTVNQGYWHYYTTTDWIDTSYWIYEDIWIEEGHWVEADINLEGRVLHTLQWDRNRISYNLSKTGTQDNPRGYEIFFNGEKFILNAYATGDFEPDLVHVELLDTEFETDLTHSSGGRWEGYIWDDSFINFHDRDCVFKFIAHYDNGIEIEDEVTVYIVRDFYWLLHRGF